MSAVFGRIGRIPARWRWTALAVAAVVAVFLLWFFLFRDISVSQSRPTGPPPIRPALGQRVPYEQYTAAVDEALSDVLDAAPLSGDERTKKLESAARALEKVEGASVERDGGISEVDNTAIISELRGGSPNLGALGGSLSTLSHSLHDSGNQTPAGIMDGERAKSTLRDVLSDPIFNYERDLSPLQRLARWLSGVTGEADPGDRLWRILTSLIAGLAVGTFIYLATGRLKSRWARLLLAVAGGLSVAVIFYALAGIVAADLSSSVLITFEILAAVGLVVAAIAAALFFTGLYRASAPPSAPRQLSDLAAALGMSASEARKRADEAAAADDYRLAIRFRCLALLLALDEVGMLAFDRAATDREYLFRAPGGLQDELQPLLTRFEAVWYGNAPASPSDWSDFAARAAQVEARAVSEARARKDAARRSAA